MAEKKFLDKVKFFMGISSDTIDDGFEYDGGNNADEDYGSSKPQPTASSLYPTSGAAPRSSFQGSGGSAQAGSNTQVNSSKLVNINKATGITQGSNLKVVIYQPKSFDDTRLIVDNLKNKKPVILNIEALDRDLAQKIFNFCSGALYALDGHIQQISKGIFILAPANVDVSGDLKGELESKGVFNWTGISKE